MWYVLPCLSHTLSSSVVMREGEGSLKVWRRVGVEGIVDRREVEVEVEAMGR